MPNLDVLTDVQFVLLFLTLCAGGLWLLARTFPSILMEPAMHQNDDDFDPRSLDEEIDDCVHCSNRATGTDPTGEPMCDEHLANCGRCLVKPWTVSGDPYGAINLCDDCQSDDAEAQGERDYEDFHGGSAAQSVYDSTYGRQR